MKRLLVALTVFVGIAQQAQASDWFGKLKDQLVPKTDDFFNRPGACQFVPAPEEDQWNFVTRRSMAAQRKFTEDVAQLGPIGKAFKHVITSAMTATGVNFAEDENVKSTAINNKWTYDKCRKVGAALFAPLIIIKGKQICDEITEDPTFSPHLCLTAVSAGAWAITEITCTTLCQDRVLEDCKNI